MLLCLPQKISSRCVLLPFIFPNPFSSRSSSRTPQKKQTFSCPFLASHCLFSVLGSINSKACLALFFRLSFGFGIECQKKSWNFEGLLFLRMEAGKTTVTSSLSISSSRTSRDQDEFLPHSDDQDIFIFQRREWIVNRRSIQPSHVFDIRTSDLWTWP